MREPHLAPVHGAIARALHDAQYVLVPRVEYHPLDGGLEVVSGARANEIVSRYRLA